MSRWAATLGATAALGWAGQAYALEGFDPHEPGISTAVPAGALPPPGFYFGNDLSYVDGSLKNGSGNSVPGGANVTAWVEVPAITWVSPFHILGASYAVAVVQPIVNVSITSATATGGRARSDLTGLFNTVVNPAILSWQLPLGFFVSGSIPIYLKDGYTRGIANNTWTFAPSAAVSWFNGAGLDASINAEYDIQTKDDDTFIATALGPVPAKYQSGNILNTDFHVQQAFGKWTPGIIGYWAVQTDDDKVTPMGLSTITVPGSAFNGAGNRAQEFALGVSLSYNFGPVTVNGRYTRDLYAKNAFQTDRFWFRIALPL